MPPRNPELRSAQWHRSERALERKLENCSRPNADTVHMRQPSPTGCPKWRIRAFHQYVAPISYLGGPYSSWPDHAHRWIVTILDQRTRQFSAALYIYSAYSPFEDLLNTHMSEGLPITPVTSMDQLDIAGNASFVSLTNSTRYIRHIPVDFSLLRDITLLDR